MSDIRLAVGSPRERRYMVEVLAQKSVPLIGEDIGFVFLVDSDTAD